MSVDAYKHQAQFVAPEELSRNVFKSIRLYLEDYKDTSKTKAERKHAIESALTIVQWCVMKMQFRVDSFEKEIVLYGFAKVLETVAVASNDMSRVYDVRESIGFLKIIE